MDVGDFAGFFRAVHGFNPFPWQKRLLSVVEQNGWPEIISLPTSAGKTSVIDVAVFSMALRIIRGKNPQRRIFYTVDRRFVVDEAYLAAMRLRESLVSSMGTDNTVGEVARALASSAMLKGSQPLEVIRMHGGIPHEPIFIKNPLQPTLIMTTVDQIGSRLLFRGYGVSPFMRPVHAALAGKDSIIILDEAHLSEPFLKTLNTVKKYQGQEWSEISVGNNLSVVSMSATHTGSSGTAFGLDSEDLADPLLSRRLTVSKPVKLIKLKGNRESDHVKQVQHLAEEFSYRVKLVLNGRKNAAVSVVVNTVALANSIYSELSKYNEAEVVKIVGRIRPFERDTILENILPKMKAGAEDQHRNRPIIVVSTQTIEVGANLDFDVMISENAPLSSLQQRFGRLNRLGSKTGSFGEIVYSPEREEINASIYGDAWKNAWKWLDTVKSHDVVDFGPIAFENLKQTHPAPNLGSNLDGTPLLMPSHLDLLAQTSPEPAFQPSIPLLLHGTSESSPDVQVIWRADIPEDLEKLGEKGIWETLASIPPNSYEAAPIPIWAVKKFLEGLESDFPDVEGSKISDSNSGQATSRKAFVWNGMQGGKIVGSKDIDPGQTLILPSAYGGYDRFGWNPDYKLPVADIAEAAASKVYRRQLFRLHPALASSWFINPDSESVEKCRELLKSMIADFTSGEDLHDLVESYLIRISELPDIRPAVAESLGNWASAGHKRKEWIYPSVQPSGLVLEMRVRQATETTDEDDSSSYSADVSLEDHSKGVAKYVRTFANSLGLPNEIVSDLSTAGLLHDLGKSDPRFQSWLRGGMPWNKDIQPLAKSRGAGIDLNAILAARDKSGYPSGGRHECYSLAILDSTPELIEGKAGDPDLVKYIVGSHHGRGRALMPVVKDNGTSIDINFLGVRVNYHGYHGLDRIDSEWPSLFWRMLKRYGYWGLPYLEMIVRLGDHRESEEEAENHGK